MKESPVPTWCVARKTGSFESRPSSTVAARGSGTQAAGKIGFSDKRSWQRRFQAWCGRAGLTFRLHSDMRSR